MTDYLTFEDIMAIHLSLTGAAVARDPGAIMSAAGRPKATVMGDDAYPTIWHKAAALFQSLACNHGFVDGNKRTAWIAVMVFLEINGHPVLADINTGAAEEFVIAVATGAIRDIDTIADGLTRFAQ